jgi:hypothetical protein
VNGNLGASKSASGANSAAFSWNPVPGASFYYIRTSLTLPSGGPYGYIQNITPTTFTDTGLNPGTTYYYQVTAVNAAGVSTNATVTVVPAPLAPISLSAVAGNGSADTHCLTMTNAKPVHYLRRRAGRLCPPSAGVCLVPSHVITSPPAGRGDRP